MIETREDSMKKRIMEAKKYQKMAIQALIPKEQKQHMECMEKEMKTMLVNGVLDLLIETGTMERVMKYAMQCFCGEGSDGNCNDEMESSRQVNYHTETEYVRQMKENIGSENSRQVKENAGSENSRQMKENAGSEYGRQMKYNVGSERNGQTKHITEKKINRKSKVRKVEVGA